jgi:glutamine synthetase
VFCAAVIRGVHKYGGVLRAVVASASNDHRLGANEAPPAIISIFLGEQLADVFDQIAKGGATSSKEKGTLTVGVDTLPPLPTDPGDRNRTSPFAFTGNRFEFRAPGASQSIAGPMIAVNTILAESIDYCATKLEAAVAAGTDFNTAVQQLLHDIITEHGAVVFNGNGYSDEWQLEAAARGLLNLRTTVDALPQLQTPEAIELFSKYGVLNERELKSRYDVYVEQYINSVTVEARAALKVAKTQILPAALRHQSELAANLANLKAIGADGDTAAFDAASTHIAALRAGIAQLSAAIAHHGPEDPLGEAKHACEHLLPAMGAVRAAADALEAEVADDLWPLPTYQEMLFIL